MTNFQLAGKLSNKCPNRGTAAGLVERLAQVFQTVRGALGSPPGRRLWAGLAAVCALVLMTGCASAPKDETPVGTAERLYKDAREDMEAGSFDRAIKSLERVEGLAAGSVMAQQAVLDMAYLHWKTDDRVQALSTIERFIKLNPSSPALDYALYLRGVINFNDNLGLLGAVGGQDLSEREVNAALDGWHGFADRALLRRSLIDHGLFSRTEDGRLYRRIEGAPSATAAALIKAWAKAH